MQPGVRIARQRGVFALDYMCVVCVHACHHHCTHLYAHDLDAATFIMFYGVGPKLRETLSNQKAMFALCRSANLCLSASRDDDKPQACFLCLVDVPKAVKRPGKQILIVLLCSGRPSLELYPT